MYFGQSPIVQWDTNTPPPLPAFTPTGDTAPLTAGPVVIEEKWTPTQRLLMGLAIMALVIYFTGK